MPAWADRSLASITHEDVSRWLAQMLADGLSPSRARACYQTVRAVLQFSVRSGYLMRNLAPLSWPARAATPKKVQRVLGHASITTTLDHYGHLFPDDLDRVADRLDAALTDI